MIARSEWWTTPVWTYETGFDQAFNKQLQAEIYSVGQEIAGGSILGDSLWDYSRPNLDILKTFILAKAIESARAGVQEAADLNLSLKYSGGWVNVIEHGDDGIEAHAHNDCSMTATYYIQAAEGCGDLVLLNTEDLMAENGSFAHDGWTPLPHKHIKPKAGQLVLFPGYVIHEVQPNKSGALRVSLSTDMQQVIDKSAPNAMIIQSWCKSMLKLRDNNV